MRGRVPSQLGPTTCPTPCHIPLQPPSWCPLQHTRHSPPQAHKQQEVCACHSSHIRAHKRTRVGPWVVGPGGAGGGGENHWEHQPATPLLSTREHTAGLKGRRELLRGTRRCLPPTPPCPHTRTTTPTAHPKRTGTSTTDCTWARWVGVWVHGYMGEWGWVHGCMGAWAPFAGPPSPLNSLNSITKRVAGE